MNRVQPTSLGKLFKNQIKEMVMYQKAYFSTTTVPDKALLSTRKYWYFLISPWYSWEAPLLGSSNEYPQSMFLSRNKKNNAYPCKPQFYYIKVGFKGVNIIQTRFRYDAYWKPAQTRCRLCMQFDQSMHSSLSQTYMVQIVYHQLL